MLRWALFQLSLLDKLNPPICDLLSNLMIGIDKIKHTGAEVGQAKPSLRFKSSFGLNGLLLVWELNQKLL